MKVAVMTRKEVLAVDNATSLSARILENEEGKSLMLDIYTDRDKIRVYFPHPGKTFQSNLSQIMRQIQQQVIEGDGVVTIDFTSYRDLTMLIE